MALRVLIDLNVLLDALQQRKPFAWEAGEILAAAEIGALEGRWAAHHVTTLFYLYARAVSSQEARRVLTELISFLKVAPITQGVIERALQLPLKDFEDAVAAAASVEIGAAYLVTRNEKDFAGSPVPVLSPAELLKLLSSP